MNILRKISFIACILVLGFLGISISAEPASATDQTIQRVEVDQSKLPIRGGRVLDLTSAELNPNEILLRVSYFRPDQDSWEDTFGADMYLLDQSDATLTLVATSEEGFDVPEILPTYGVSALKLNSGGVLFAGGIVPSLENSESAGSNAEFAGEPKDLEGKIPLDLNYFESHEQGFSSKYTSNVLELYQGQELQRVMLSSWNLRGVGLEDTTGVPLGFKPELRQLESGVILATLPEEEYPHLNLHNEFVRFTRGNFAFNLTQTRKMNLQNYHHVSYTDSDSIDYVLAYSNPVKVPSFIFHDDKFWGSTKGAVLPFPENKATIEQDEEGEWISIPHERDSYHLIEDITKSSEWRWSNPESLLRSTYKIVNGEWLEMQLGEESGVSTRSKEGVRTLNLDYDPKLHSQIYIDRSDYGWFINQKPIIFFGLEEPNAELRELIERESIEFGDVISEDIVKIDFKNQEWEFIGNINVNLTPYIGEWLNQIVEVPADRFTETPSRGTISGGQTPFVGSNQMNTRLPGFNYSWLIEDRKRDRATIGLAYRFKDDTRGVGCKETVIPTDPFVADLNLTNGNTHAYSVEGLNSKDFYLHDLSSFDDNVWAFGDNQAREVGNPTLRFEVKHSSQRAGGLCDGKFLLGELKILSNEVSQLDVVAPRTQEGGAGADQSTDDTQTPWKVPVSDLLIAYSVLTGAKGLYLLLALSKE